MSGITGLVDTVLAAKLSQRLDQLGLRPAVEVAAPGPTVAVEKAGNDVRLPSHAALDRQISADPRVLPRPVPPQPSDARLSVAACVISTVLTGPEAEAGPVRGAAPLWPSSQPPATRALAGTLAQTVAASGLFYESHLLEFAGGQRSLSQLAQEPHARWAPGAPSRSGPAISSAPAETVLPEATKEAQVVRAGQGAVLTPGEQGSGSRPAATATAAAPPTNAGQGEGMPPPRGLLPSAGPTAQDTAGPALTPPQLAYLWVEAASAATAAATLPEPPHGHRAGETAEAPAGMAAPAVPSGPPVAEVIHPQAVALVHQQLDLLATAVFRWSGQAWPGVPMEWSVQEEAPADRHTDTPPDEAHSRRWTTTVSLTLPRLGTVDVRLSLAGPAVHAALAASDAATLARLRGAGSGLAQRLESAGLRLDELQITRRSPL